MGFWGPRHSIDAGAQLLRHREPVPPPEAHSAEAPAEERDGRPNGAAGFDWWAAPTSRPRAAAEALDQAVPEQTAPVQEIPVQAPPEPQPGLDVQVEPEMARGVAEPAETFREPRPEPPARAPRAAEVYRHVQSGEEFQEVRREYRRFVFPACAAFLAWYLAYIVAAVTLPGLMAHQLAGPFTVAWALGLLQFGSTFLITWLYARHARDRRDRLALGLRWETQDRLR
jgi:uncharacterized membrane protein (DUF485 family)